MKKRILTCCLSLTVMLTGIPYTATAEPSAPAGVEEDSSLQASDETTLSETEGDGSEEKTDTQTNVPESETDQDDTKAESDDPVSDSIADEGQDKEEETYAEPGTITGFRILDASESLISTDQHMLLSELLDEMPDYIEVYIDGSSELQKIPVIWTSETDYETTDESYYIFWASWDEDTYPLASDYNHEDYIPFVEVTIDLGIYYSGDLSGYSLGVQHIVERAYEQVNISWTPLHTVNGFSSSTDPLTVFYEGVTYTGIPYGQLVYSGAYVPFKASFDTFLNAVNTDGSLFYTARGSYLDMDSTYYGNDCSAFVSYCYGIPRMTTSSFAYSSLFSKVSGNNIYNAEVGDCFNRSGHHIELITGMNYDDDGNLVSVEVSEQTPPKARTVLYSPSEVQSLINNGGYTLLRYSGRDSVAAPLTYDGYEEDMAQAEGEDMNEDPEMTIEDINGDGSSYQINVSGLKSSSGTSYTAAVWSEENGQDDLRWNTLTYISRGTKGFVLKPSSYNSPGLYNIHVYSRNNATGVMTLVITGTLNVPTVSAEAVVADTPNQNAGSCRITVSGVACAGSVVSVTVPVWSAADQSDIHWYHAEKLNDTDWYVDINTSNHSYHTGTYQVHAYGTSAAGFMTFLGCTSVKFTAPETSISAVSVNEDQVDISVTGAYTANGIRSITAAVWSEENNQDDLKWNPLSYDSSSRTASGSIYLSDYSHYGRFQIHVYAVNKTGQMILLGTTTVDAEEPEPNNVICDYDNETGDFTVTIVHPKLTSGTIDSIVVPVWSAANQSDIRWYEAARKSGNRYTISGNISNHNGCGSYQCHIYARSSGKMILVGRTGFTAAISAGEIRVADGTDETTYPVTISNLTSPIKLTSVQAAVWSKQNDQDDLRWYTMDGTSGTCTGTINIRNHKTKGLYYVHIYGITSSGRYVYIDAADFTVGTSASAVITADDKGCEDGTFLVTIHVTEQTSGISNIVVPVWSASDQSDIHWYNASLQEDGTWTVLVEKKYHKNNSGTYRIHSYATFDNGIFSLLATTSRKNCF